VRSRGEKERGAENRRDGGESVFIVLLHLHLFLILILFLSLILLLVLLFHDIPLVPLYLVSLPVPNLYCLLHYY
jgi:hypothetical protein